MAQTEWSYLFDSGEGALAGSQNGENKEQTGVEEGKLVCCGFTL